ncbi:apolipoprotein N-acyltransferase [Acuticoccus sp. M5D2P5]|uniref:apolipoprotein N-acyltransferase n=1 Tax=Acuticoccus kalidii TaxID=2910977 RepID=UPI001F323DB5|nr:apolipoprotein N-acyltransferase [Acuticoccus kalidii]MCF3936420.1 apolipoprotein N-acyltransferase [Acuticoccus kalidii]
MTASARTPGAMWSDDRRPGTAVPAAALGASTSDSATGGVGATSAAETGAEVNARVRADATSGGESIAGDLGRYLRRRRIRLLLAFLAGVLLAFGLPPYDILPAIFAYSLFIPVLVIGDAWAKRPLLERALLGAAFGFGYHLMGLWWVGAAFLVDADTFGVLLPFGVIGLPLLLCPFYALAAALTGLAPPSIAWRTVAFAIALSFTDYLRGILFTGFPWNTAGFGLSNATILAQSAAVVGVNGLAIAAVLFGATPAILLFKTSRWLLVPTAAIFGVMLLFGLDRLSNAPVAAADTQRVRVVQPSIPQDQKWQTGRRDEIWQTLLDLSKSDGGRPPDVVVWPETSIPFLYRSPSLEATEVAEALQWTATLVTGAVELAEGSDRQKVTNSILVVGPDGEVKQRYDKVHLVPFGEYVPFAGLLEQVGFRGFVEQAGDFEAGEQRESLIVPGLPKALPLICYEVIFPSLRPGRDVAWIVNVTNDAWFGDTPGPRQHLRQAQLRAIEEGLPVVRAANNGISAVIDTEGRTVAELPLNARAAIDAQLPRVRSALYPALGDRPLFVVWLLAIVAAGAWRLRRGAQREKKSAS